MSNKFKVLITNEIGLPTNQELYLYIIGGEKNGTAEDYYSYNLNADQVAIKGANNVVHPVALSSLVVDSTNAATYYFYFDQSSNFSGRIWFSTSNDLVTISKLAVSQPNPSDGKLFDFVELTINPNDNVNCDTTQVVGLGIPITMINPSKLTFPPNIAEPSLYTYPDAVGIVPGQSLDEIQSNFKKYVKSTGLDSFAACATSYTNATTKKEVQWLINPGYQVSNYNSATAPTGLAIALDTAIFEFFNHYVANELVFHFEGIVYTGKTITKAGLDPSNPTQKYTALIFTDASSNSYPIFYPYFSTNSVATQGGALNPSGVLPPAPAFWTVQGLETKTPASGQVLLCDGAFNDSNPTVGNATILSALQNIVVSMLNRGLVPGSTINNLFVCSGNLVLDSAPVSFTDKTPSDSSTIVGATLVYKPSQIPLKTDPSTCTITGSVQLENALKKEIKQSFLTIDGIVTVTPPKVLPANYCNTPAAAQFAPDTGVEFAFSYVSAAWPDTKSPELVGPITGSYTPLVTTASEASFTTTDSVTAVTAGMNVFDLNVQNPATVASVGTGEVTIKSAIDGILPSPHTDTLLFGNFFPKTTTGKANGQWNAFASFLHYGGDQFAAPYISSQGYAFAYDDDGGYSSDITINFNESAAPSIGIYLGKLIAS